MSAGVKHLTFWKLCGNTLTPTPGSWGQVGEVQSMLCLAFGPEDTTLSGSLAGDIYVWKGSDLDHVVSAAHNVSIYFGCYMLWTQKVESLIKKHKKINLYHVTSYTG